MLLGVPDAAKASIDDPRTKPAKAAASVRGASEGGHRTGGTIRHTGDALSSKGKKVARWPTTGSFPLPIARLRRTAGLSFTHDAFLIFTAMAPDHARGSRGDITGARAEGEKKKKKRRALSGACCGDRWLPQPTRTLTQLTAENCACGQYQSRQRACGKTEREREEEREGKARGYGGPGGWGKRPNRGCRKPRAGSRRGCRWLGSHS